MVGRSARRIAQTLSNGGAVPRQAAFYINPHWDVTRHHHSEPIATVTDGAIEELPAIGAFYTRTALRLANPPRRRQRVSTQQLAEERPRLATLLLSACNTLPRRWRGKDSNGRHSQTRRARRAKSEQNGNPTMRNRILGIGKALVRVVSAGKSLHTVHSSTQRTGILLSIRLAMLITQSIKISFCKRG